MNGIVVLEITFITFSLIKPEVGEWNRNFQFSEIFIIEFGMAGCELCDTIEHAFMESIYLKTSERINANCKTKLNVFFSLQ